MKKIIVTTIFLCSLGFASAQTKDTIASNVESTLYLAIGGQLQNNLNINQILTNSNLKTIPNSMHTFVFGINSFAEKFSGCIEFSGNYADRLLDTNAMGFITWNYRGNFSYNLINKPKIAFATGLNVAYTYSEINIFNTNTIIDLNNLNPISNSSSTQLYNNMVFIGPAVSLYLFKNTGWQIRVNAAYEFGITRGSWQSDFVNVNNTVNERGIRRFVFGITLI